MSGLSTTWAKKSAEAFGKRTRTGSLFATRAFAVEAGRAGRPAPKRETAQLVGEPEEELLQGKRTAAQRQAAEEGEEELLQGKAAVAQRQAPEEEEEEELLQGRFMSTQRVRPRPEPESADRDSSLPDGLRLAVESLSGVSMDGVRVHYNTSKPAQLDALAYAQGTDIHLGPGQERHLPHEAWHIVQQAQGRVRPTTRTASGVPVNDDKGLEREADVKGAEAARQARAAGPTRGRAKATMQAKGSSNRDDRASELETQRQAAHQRGCGCAGCRATVTHHDAPAEVRGTGPLVQRQVTAWVGRRSYDSTRSQHAEERMFASGRYDEGDFTVELNAWPCTGERRHDCHKLFKDKSAGRTITVDVGDDHGGYARNHGKDFGDTGTITYNKGAATYS